MSTLAHVWWQEFRCGNCGHSLGEYLISMARSDRQVLLGDRRNLPKGMQVLVAKLDVEFVSGEQVTRVKSRRRPRLYHELSYSGPLGYVPDPGVALSFLPKYRWGCGCGAQPVYRSETLYMLLKHHQGPSGQHHQDPSGQPRGCGFEPHQDQPTAIYLT